jgi:penicillin amidase
MPGTTAARLLGVAGRARETAGIAARAALAAAHTAAKRAHPIEDGRLTVRGLDGRVEVIRDRHGVPHIYAASEADALFGQGFVHAQDRLFQMDSLRRAGAGRIAEWAGPGAVEADRLLRRLGFVDIAGRDLAAADPAERELLVAFTAGVNAGIASLPALPPEYVFLGATPEPWHPEHTMMLGRFVLFSFAANWDTELIRERLLRALGPEHAASLEPVTRADAHTVTGVPPAEADRLLEAYRSALSLGIPGGGGSNAWAVTAERTRTGAPMLASDPHLDSRMPGLLHVSHVVGGRFDVIGANVPGVPLVAMGHNRDLAWGITAGLADVSDLYVETLNPEQPTQTRTPDGWRTGRSRIERIEVRGGEPVEERVLETRHGPVISPTVPGESRVIALRCTGLEPGDPLGPVLDLCRATTVEAFDEAVSRRPGVTFNYIYAHRAGRIGYRMSGSVPRRAQGEGLLPQDGARTVEVPGYLDSDEMPHLLDPARGFVISANQDPGVAAELGEDFCEPERAERIRVLIEAQERHTLSSFAAMQVDHRSHVMVEFRDTLLAARATEDAELLALLRAWVGDLDADSAAAALLETTLREAAHAVARRLAGEHGPMLLGANLGAPLAGSSFALRSQGWVVRALATPEPPCFTDAEERDRLLRASLSRAVATLRDRLGARPAGWRWGELHRWRLPHPLNAVPGLGRWFSRGPYPLGGDLNTVWQAALSLTRETDTVSIVPGYRQVVDLADLDRSLFQLSTGNSGIPGHPRYGDCIDEYRAGAYRPLLFTRAAVEAAAEHTLTLEPA